MNLLKPHFVLKKTRSLAGMECISMICLALSLSSCWAVAAGAGAEAGYIAAQDDRTAGQTVQDQSITAAVKSKLIADPEISGLNINVDTFRGVVTLKGTVDSSEEAANAIKHAQAVEGVKKVNSMLRVD